MEARPAGITDDQVAKALLEGWGFAARQIDYAPVGFGSYHWVVADGPRDRRFVTVDDLDGDATSRAAAFESLARAFATARTLQQRGLDFVVAHQLSAAGEQLRHLSEHHTIAVFPYVDGRAGSFGDVMGEVDRGELIDVLAALHGATTNVRSMAPRLAFAPVVRSKTVVEAALDSTESRWTGGPFA